MCNATTKHGSKCKRPNSFGDFCHYHRYLDDDFQPGAIENIKPSVNYSQYTIDTCTSQPIINTHKLFNWLEIFSKIVRLFK
jgi:hypothetical protein